MKELKHVIRELTLWNKRLRYSNSILRKANDRQGKTIERLLREKEKRKK